MPDGFSQHTLIAATTPNWEDGYVPPAAEWNAWWAQKLDIGDPIVLMGPYLRLVGGTLTGPLVLAGDPTDLLNPATKSYTDAADTVLASAVGLKLAKAGDTMTGPLVLSGDPTLPLHAATKAYIDAINTALLASKVNRAGDSLTGPLSLAGDPVGALDAVTKQYSDLHVLLTGGTLTGPLTLVGDPTAPAHASTKSYVDAQITATTTFANATFVPLSQKAAALGIATLDATGVIPTTQLPGSVTGTLNYRGGWNAATNTPAMTSGAFADGIKQFVGYYYVVTQSGTTASIDGVTTWVAGDWISSNGTIWQKVQNSTSPYLPLTGGTLSGALTTYGGGTLTALDPRIPDVAYGWQDAAGNVGAFIDTQGGFHMPAAYVAGNPTLPLQLAPKQYVDSTAAAQPFLPLVGGTLTGTETFAGGASMGAAGVYVPDIGFAWQDAAGNIGMMIDPQGAFRMSVAHVSVTPTQSTQVAPKSYVDSAIVAAGPGLVSGTLSPTLLNLQENSIAALDPRIPDIKFSVQDAAGNIIGDIGTNGRLNWQSVMFGTAAITSAAITQITTGAYQVTATGVDQATAAPVLPGVVRVVTADAGTGIVLVSVTGAAWLVYHSGANPLAVYPPSGAAIGPSAPNAPLSLMPGSGVVLWQTSASNFGVMQAGAGGGGGSSVYVGTGFIQPRDEHDRVADTVNVYDLVSGLDPTGVLDNSTAIKTAHDAARTRGYRYLAFPKGVYNTPTLTTAGGVIFVGDGASLKGAYRKMILPMRAGTYGRPAATLVPAHIPRLRAAMAAATTVAPAKIAIVGDSTTALAADTAAGENLKSLLFRALKRQFGNAPFVIDELGIGGSRFDHLAIPGPPTGLTFPAWYTNTSLRWMSYVQSGNYDLVILNFGTNDQINLDIWCIDSVVTEIQAFAHPADIAFTAQYTPQLNNSGTGSRAAQEGREYAEGYIRTYAARKGFGLFDFNRQTTIIRDGWDPLEGSMKLLTIADQNFPYTLPQETLHYAWRGIVSAGVWSHGKLRFQIGARADNLLIIERDAATLRLAYTVQSIATTSPYITSGTIYNSVPYTVTPLDLTTDPVLSYDFEVRGGQVFCRVTAGANFYEINVMCDRYGGLFTPVISWSDGSTSVAVSVKVATAFVPNVYMPQATDDEMFIDGHGADGLTHIQAGGMARVWAPVIDSARFA